MFFRVWKGGCKKLIPALAAAAAVAMASFVISNGLFRWQNNKLMNLAADVKSAIVINQGTWTADLPTLNNRTQIWMGALLKIQNDPWILLRGAEDTKIDLEFFVASHSHNAWMETLLWLGISAHPVAYRSRTVEEEYRNAGFGHDGYQYAGTVFVCYQCWNQLFRLFLLPESGISDPMEPGIEEAAAN